MARRLGDLADRLAWATDLDRVRELARSVENELRTEGEAWIDVMRSHDVELPS
jgi:predicted nuclease with TOPRIM domain